MINIDDFITKQKCMVIAPAGFGKTHTISQCVELTLGRQLILTHTNAGIASIKEKLTVNNVPTSKYHIETISGFAQKYVNAFCKQSDIPTIKDKQYYITIYEKAAELFSKNPVLNIIKYTYTGLFVDEYQDCTLKQHNLILQLAEKLPTRLFADPLQGIFNFNPKADPLIDIDTEMTLIEYRQNKYVL